MPITPKGHTVLTDPSLEHLARLAEVDAGNKARREERAKIAIEGTYLSQSDANHLRRLIAWIRCDIGQSPEEMVAMMQDLGPKLGDISENGKERMVVAYRESQQIPQYVRAGVKALTKTLENLPADNSNSRAEREERRKTAGRFIPFTPDNPNAADRRRAHYSAELAKEIPAGVERIIAENHRLREALQATFTLLSAEFTPASLAAGNWPTVRPIMDLARAVLERK